MTEFINQEYIHNMLADILNTTLNWIIEETVPRARFATISTYDKAVERIRQLQAEDPNVPPLPAVMLDPQQPRIPEGTVLWRFSNISNNPSVLRSFDPIIETDDFKIIPIFQFVETDIDVVIFVPSVYEYLDTSVRINDFFGGVNRYVRPRIINSYIIMPSKLHGKRYENKFTGKDYEIDLSNVTSTNLIKSLGEELVCFDVLLSPRYKLTSISDNSQKYGGGSDISDWRVLFSMKMEVQIPTWLIFKTDCKIDSVYVKTRLAYVGYPEEIDKTGRIISKPAPVTDMVLPCQDDNKSKVVTFQTRYAHFIDNDIDPDDSPLVLDLPIQITPDYHLIVWSYGGEMDEGAEYELQDNNTKILFKVPFKVGDVIEFWYYKTE